MKTKLLGLSSMLGGVWGPGEAGRQQMKGERGASGMEEVFDNVVSCSVTSSMDMGKPGVTEKSSNKERLFEVGNLC